ncbi:MAG TPA: hypothetical protein VLR47_02400, partial [Rhodospirillales bacterium]|nr:hypothetical protein [Rhodospirillales bacterium]
PTVVMTGLVPVIHGCIDGRHFIMQLMAATSAAMTGEGGTTPPLFVTKGWVSTSAAMTLITISFT